MKRTRTVMDVLKGARARINREPRSYKQTKWMQTPGHTVRELLDLPEPPCGTSFCRAGHIVMVLDGWEGIKNLITHRGDSCAIETRAFDIILPATLKLSEEDRSLFRSDLDELFGGWSLERVRDPRAINLNAVRDTLPEVGTDRYARLGSQGMTRFMEKWAHVLEATEAPLPLASKLQDA